MKQINPTRLTCMNNIDMHILCKAQLIHYQQNTRLDVHGSDLHEVCEVKWLMTNVVKYHLINYTNYTTCSYSTPLRLVVYIMEYPTSHLFFLGILYMYTGL